MEEKIEEMLEQKLKSYEDNIKSYLKEKLSS